MPSTAIGELCKVIWLFSRLALAGALAAPAAAHEIVPATAETHDRDIDAWFAWLAQVNSPSILEPAGSQGSFGARVGAGFSMIRVPEHNPILSAETGTDHEESHAPVPRVTVVKGLPIPVDFGFTGSVTPDRSITQAAATLQVTVFEKFRWPALSIRGSAGRVFGLESTSFNSRSASAVVGYGFLRFFNVYALAGISEHRGELRADGKSEFAFLLDDEQRDFEYAAVWREQERRVGLRATLWPPFVTLTTEAAVNGVREREYSVKLSAGI